MTVLSYKHTCSEILCCSLLEIELIVCHLLALQNKSTSLIPHQYNKHHTPLLSQLFYFSLTPELCVKFKLFLNKLAGRENFVFILIQKELELSFSAIHESSCPNNQSLCRELVHLSYKVRKSK